MFTIDTVCNLIQNTDSLMQELKEAYEGLPHTRCQRRTLCCSMLPEMTLAEALFGIRQAMNMQTAKRLELLQDITRYFFLNPVEIQSCPFLDDTDCLIYDNRFLGCRTYGLWSKAYYEKLVQQSREFKKQLQKQWYNLGIILPRAVIDFHVPYCPHVEIIGPSAIDDKVLLQVTDTITAVSARFSPWHQLFEERYFSDFSFLVTATALGFQKSIQMKFSIVGEILNTGSRVRLDRLVRELSDIFAD